MVDVDPSLNGTPVPVSKDSLELGRKTVIAGEPGEIDMLADQMWEGRADFSLVVDCWKCEKPLPLAQNPVTWSVGPFDYYFPRVPSYQCGRCEATYFPEGILDALGVMIDLDLPLRGLEAPVMNERTREFYRVYRDSPGVSLSS